MPLTRRTFMTTSATAIAASPFSSFLAKPPPLRGVWWFYPSFLEHPEGPWGTRGDRDESPLHLWKSCLSWLADHGVNAAFIHLGPFGGDLSPLAMDRIRTGWGFHYLLDFERFPEARTFDRATLARNRDLLNAICAHGKQVGCSVHTHHYNFSATKPFVDAHREELLRVPVGKAAEIKTLYPGFCDQKQIVHRNLCWNRPLYRDFLVACWDETCRAIPDLAGILVTPGENARCPCVACVGRTDERGAPFATSKERLSTLSDFVVKFAATLERHGRKPMVRAWAAGKSRPWIETFPKGVTYFLKYSLFDVVDCEPDPAIREWVAAGHDVVATPEIQGGENCGPMLWRRPGYLPAVVEKSLAAGASGIVACVNSEHGFLSTPLRVQHSPIVLFANAIENGGDDRELSVACDLGVFGEAGDRVHAALEACCEITFALPRIVFEPEEGFTWQFAYHVFSEEWPGRIGGSIAAEPWIAGGIASLKTWLAAARERPLAEPFPPEALGGGSDPLEFVKRALERAAGGEQELLAIEGSIPDAAHADFALAKLSARLAVLLGEEWVALLTAVMCLEAALRLDGAEEGSDPEGATTRASLEARCLAAFDSTIAAIDATSEVAKQFPKGVVGDAIVLRLPRKREQRFEERAEAARRLGVGKRH